MKKVVKRNKEIVDYDEDKIRLAIKQANSEVPIKHRINNSEIDSIVSFISSLEDEKLNVEEIQDRIEQKLMELGKFRLAKQYITYRYKHELIRKSNTTDETIRELLDGKSEYWNTENSNKNARVVTTQRDYIAGVCSTDISRRLLLPEDVVKAHDKGIIHFHDMDYYGQNALHNCDLINLDDMLQNGTMINGVMIEKPHKLITAMTIATQIITAVASSQYGGCSINLSDLAPFVRDSYTKYLSKYAKRGFNDKDCKKYADEDLKQEIKAAVQTFNYQINSMSTTNGQAPFLTVFMYLNERPEYKDEHAMLIEEFLNQRILGMKNSKGVYVTPAFPKLIYVLEEDNIEPNSKYYYLTVLSAKCSAKRLVPDYISEKVMKELKVNSDGSHSCYAVMGALAYHEHLYVKINDGEAQDISIGDLFHLCKDNREIKGRPMQLYYNQEELPHEIDYTWRSHRPKNNIDMFEEKSGVYKVTYIPQDLSYIGSTRNVKHRFREHLKKIRHYGGLDGGVNFKDTNINNYKFEVLEYTSEYEEVEKKYIQEIPNVNFRGISSKYYKNVGLNHSKGSDTRPIITMNPNVPQEFIDLNNANIKVLDRDDKWVKIKHIFKNDSYNTPLMMHITYKEFDKEYTLTCTEDHPLWTGEKFIKACELTTNDFLYRGDYLKLPIIRIKYCLGRRDSYDIGTETGSFIGSDIIMHNCRSALTPDRFSDKLGNIAKAKNYVEGQPKFSGRFNQGVVTINLVDVALSSKGDFDKFWKLMDKRTELCHKAMQLRHERLEGITSDVAPILWQDGALARLDKGESLHELLHNGYSTISLGYAGLYECVKFMTNCSHSDGGVGEEFGLKVMQYINDKCAKWKAEENIDYSVYGTPIESTTYKFAKCLKKRFGNDIFEKLDGKDRNYITNSYHIPVFEEINPFEKLEKEAKFQKLSPGGAISYIECSNLTHNVEAVLQIIRFIYDHIMYAELNTKSDYCQKCGYTGEILLDDNLEWYCPNCNNRDHNLLNVARRTCGYIGSNFWNKGRTQEIKERYVHLDNKDLEE